MSNGVTSDDGLIKFAFNTPVRVALKYGEGKLVEGRYGDQLLFSCTDGRRFFVPPLVGEEIAKLGIRPGEPITITKCEVTEGRKRTAVYQVDRDAGSPAASAPPMASPAAAAPKPAVAPVPASAAPASPEPLSLRRVMYDHYRAAIDILVEAEKYGKAKGLALEFNAEDVRALAATLFIERRGSQCQL
jgi:hypothetical protein